MDEKLIKFTLPSPGTGQLSTVSHTAVADAPTKARILVAEDDPVSRQLISTRLAKWGYVGVIASDGAEAMTILRGRDAPSLAILDWSMPHMDGIEICRRLRDAERMIYIILLTANGSKENIVDGLRAGADDYLVKPFHAEELHARILVGLRAMAAQGSLANRVLALEKAISGIGPFELRIPL